MRKSINQFLRAYRLKLVPIKEDFEPIHLDKTVTNPACLNYLGNKQPVVMEASLDLGRALPLFSFTKQSRHPYVMAIQQALKSDSPRNKIKATLNSYYKSFQPETAAELVGLDSTHTLHKEPYWAIVLPWNNDSADQMKARIQKSVAWENKTNGASLGIADGWAWAGPVSDYKLEVETDRLFNIFESVRKNGYKRNDSADGDIQAYVLMAENGEWVWQAQVGLHRASTVAGLAYKQIPIRISKIIYRAEADFWPNVMSGLYSKEDALKIFDMIFYGQYPAEAANWSEKMKLDCAI
ncbi:hypothetical protein FVR03_10530 [Pontibacter qinzhouensis]|uniref:Uncharacterized protein n=1 Tax=Pontibacter qinzhouensis TaxID=2603253 RepID=A0A5C8K8F6_9BACT|nr:hypothetical protein [Pontibacter qinzhouensis]TXK46769.1 hypothetical protein FVR03_10530 [Pontibacter qinzhouensis]